MALDGEGVALLYHVHDAADQAGRREVRHQEQIRFRSTLLERKGHMLRFRDPFFVEATFQEKASAGLEPFLRNVHVKSCSFKCHRSDRSHPPSPCGGRDRRRPSAVLAFRWACRSLSNSSSTSSTSRSSPPCPQRE